MILQFEQRTEDGPPLDAIVSTLVKSHRANIQALKRVEFVRGDTGVLGSGKEPVLRIVIEYDELDLPQIEHAQAIIAAIKEHPNFEYVSVVELESPQDGRTK